MNSILDWQIEGTVTYADGTSEVYSEIWSFMPFAQATARMSNVVAGLLRQRKRKVKMVSIGGWGQVAGQKMYISHMETR